MEDLAQTLNEDYMPQAEIQEKNEDNLFSLPNVVGVSLGHKIKDGKEVDKKMIISVLVEKRVDKDALTDSDMVPKEIDGILTDVVEVGKIFAGDDFKPLPELDESMRGVTTARLTRRMRPCPGGFSVGHYRITAGTLGTCCYDVSPFPGIPPKYYILSNNHVLANCNDAKEGDPILQPARIDGGRYPNDVIATLSRFEAIRYISGNDFPKNVIDAAIAEANMQDIDRRIFWTGSVKRLYSKPEVGDIVQKVGRTTGLTTGEVTNINGTVKVHYGGGRVALFVQQILTTRMSQGGDSGSLVTNLDEGAVGLLFAGSNIRTILNNIYIVQKHLGIRVTEK